MIQLANSQLKMFIYYGNKIYLKTKIKMLWVII